MEYSFVRVKKPKGYICVAEAMACTAWYCSLWLQVLLVIRGLKKECDYGYPIGKLQVGVLLYFENINWYWSICDKCNATEIKHSK